MVVLAATLGCGGCSDERRQIQQHQEKLESLRATTAAIGDAWLSGAVSGTYAGTAFEQTFVLVEQERTALASAPATLADPRGARLSDAADAASRQLALLIEDVRRADAASVRTRLAKVPIAAGERR